MRPALVVEREVLGQVRPCLGNRVVCVQVDVLVLDRLVETRMRADAVVVTTPGLDHDSSFLFPSDQGVARPSMSDGYFVPGSASVFSEKGEMMRAPRLPAAL